MTDIKKIKQFLTAKLKMPVEDVVPLNKGGTSENYKISVQNKTYLLKILGKDCLKRTRRLVKIYQVLQKNKLSFVPALCTPTGKTYLRFEDNILIFMDFVDGKRLTPHNMTDDVLLEIAKEYKAFLSADFKEADFVYPFVGAQDILKNLKEIMEKNKKLKGWVRAVFCKRMTRMLDNFSKELPHIDAKKEVIHGDMGPNNFILSRDKIYYLDFELMRLGYMSEDLMQFVLSALLKHSVLFFNKRKFIQQLKLLNQIFDLSCDEWVYGAAIYFLRCAYRKLYVSKILKSPRKSWLCLNHFKKYETIVRLIKSVY